MVATQNLQDTSCKSHHWKSRGRKEKKQKDILTFSRISSARLQSGSASLYLPRFPYNTAKLFNVAAT